MPEIPVPAVPQRLAGGGGRELLRRALQGGVQHLVSAAPVGGMVAASCEVDFGVCEIIRCAPCEGFRV